MSYALINPMYYPYNLYPYRFPQFVHPNPNKYMKCQVKIEYLKDGSKYRNIDIRFNEYKEIIKRLETIANKHHITDTADDSGFKIYVPSGESSKCKIFNELTVSKKGVDKIIEMTDMFLNMI